MGDWSFSLRTKASVYCLGVRGRVGEGRVDKRNRLKRPQKKSISLGYLGFSKSPEFIMLSADVESRT